jgi:hypothetical protein
MSEDVFAQSPPSRRRWRLPFGWLGLVLLGCVVYELTQSPALGSVLVCLKFGWEDFLTARWLWRLDEHRWRRAALFWLYLAWGLWKTAIVAFFLSTAFALVARQAAPAAIPDALRAFAGTFLLTLLCFGLSTLMTFLSFFCAWRGGVRLWLDSAAHRARRLGEWPPTPWCEGRANRLGQLVLTSLALGLLALIMLLLLVAVPGGPVARVISIAATVCAPVALVVSREVVVRHLWAYRPRQCWPEEELAEHPHDPVE